MKVIESNVHTSLDKLKLVMCYALRFEDNRTRIDDLKRKLIDSEARKGEKGLKRPSIDLIDVLLDHMGQSKRIGNCFQKSSIFRMLTQGVDVRGVRACGVGRIYIYHFFICYSNYKNITRLLSGQLSIVTCVNSNT